MINSVDDFNNVFFIGIAGTGMSALAQYLNGIGKKVSGSDRYFKPDEYNETKEKLKVKVKVLKERAKEIHALNNSMQYYRIFLY